MGNNQPQMESQPNNDNVLLVPVTVNIRIGGETDEKVDYKKESFTINMPYLSSVTIANMLDKVTETMNKKHYPKRYDFIHINLLSFLGINVQENHQNWNDILAKSLTEYDKNGIATKGLSGTAIIRYIHKIYENKVTCEYALKCPIYKAMKNNYEFNENNLNHLYEFAHFKDEYNNKPRCKYGQECKSFIRLQEKGGNRIDDKCHTKLYRHPPRNNRQIQLAANMNAFLFHTDQNTNSRIHKPDWYDNDVALYNDKNGYLKLLIEEVVENGFKYDLCLQCGVNDDCEHEEYTLLTVVDEKLKHIRHKQMDNPLRRDHMLALILYTGCDCNYDLCKNQRNGNYKKWKWFDYCLHHAIRLLSDRETGLYKLYSGLNKVKVNKKEILNAYFPTYTSTSWSKNVALNFMNDEGMIIEIHEKYRNNIRVLCCDVSWISKFEDECEILISRSGDHWLFNNHFKMSILDEQHGLQTVSLAMD